jgi:REP element-mobilizing transposase RayT
MSHPWATVGKGKGGTYEYFEPSAQIRAEWGHSLPHWRQGGVIYYVTFRTADSIPQDRLIQWKRDREAWLAKHPLPRSPEQAREYRQLFTRRWHQWLDEAHGACVLKRANLRAIVEDTFRKLDGCPNGYALDEFVIMPNHAHVVVAPFKGQSLSQILKTWKSIAARRINKTLVQHGPFWQEESWDHIVRGPVYLEKYWQYIRDNPKHLPKMPKLVGRWPSADPQGSRRIQKSHRMSAEGRRPTKNRFASLHPQARWFIPSR